MKPTISFQATTEIHALAILIARQICGAAAIKEKRQVFTGGGPILNRVQHYIVSLASELLMEIVPRYAPGHKC